MNISMDANHVYTVENKCVPSVTQILQHIFPHKYDNVPETVLNRAAERGNGIHELIENYALLQTDETRMDMELNGINYAMLEKQEHINIQTSEQMICYKDMDEPLYAGKYDLQGFINDEPAILDIKTTAVCDKDYLEWQLTMYAMAYEQMTGTEIKKLACIWMPKKGTGKFIPIERLDTDYVLTEVREIVTAS